MSRVFVGVGSNINSEENIRSGISALREKFGDLKISPVYESKAVGFSGSNFYNLVIGFDTDEKPETVAAILNDIESRFGRKRKQQQISRTLDLDLLLYNDLVLDGDDLHVPRQDILEYAFVLRPLADMDGDAIHPVEKRTYRDLLQDYSHPEQALWRIDLDLD